MELAYGSISSHSWTFSPQVKEVFHVNSCVTYAFLDKGHFITQSYRNTSDICVVRMHIAAIVHQKKRKRGNE
jgi:hypothetical protein